MRKSSKFIFFHFVIHFVHSLLVFLPFFLLFSIFSFLFSQIISLFFLFSYFFSVFSFFSSFLSFPYFFFPYFFFSFFSGEGEGSTFTIEIPMIRKSPSNHVLIIDGTGTECLGTLSRRASIDQEEALALRRSESWRFMLRQLGGNLILSSL